MGAATPTFAQTIKGNVYGGGRLGKVAGNTSITIESGSVETDSESKGSNIFGGGYQAEVAGNTAIDINGGEAGNVYGGGEAANIVVGAAETGKTNVNMNGGTIHHSVYGGGLGNTTNVATSTTVTANSGTVTEDVYGGSGFGKVGATTVIIKDGATVGNDVFGGGFGQNADAGAGKDAYEADVTGNASVTINKGAKISGNVYGGNNTNGSPKGAITVLVDGPVDATEKESTPLILKDVFGGGKNAATTSSSDDILAPKVTIQGCETIIERVFGGGDAASAPATDVEIWGGHITNAFAGGNGEVVAAHVGYQADGTTEYNYGTGNTNITIKGGVIENVFGGSNTAGNIRGEVSVTVEKDVAACDMQITNLYGGGNEAPGKAGTISIVCTGEGRIENVYGGANKADITGDITLNIKGGQITNVFGGNNNSGNINGAIEVNIDWAIGDGACGNNSLGNVYGGGNLAPYYAYGYEVDGEGNWTEKAIDQEQTYGPTVNLINGTINNNVYGGGLGAAAVVTGTPTVNLIGATIGTNETIDNHTGGNIFGGGDAAPVTGNPKVNAEYGSVNDIFAGGRGSTAVVTGNTLAYINKTDDKTLTINDVYGGGALADVNGNTTVTLLSGTITGNAYGGGLGQLADAGAGLEAVEAHVRGNTYVNLGAMVDDGGGNLTPTGNATVSNIFGCNNLNGGPNGTSTVDVISGTVNHNVYGGGNLAAASVAPNVNIKGGTITESVYGGGYGATAVITGDPIVEVSAGTVTKSVFGGGSLAGTNGATSVTVSGGTVSEDVYGGGALANVSGATTVVISGGTINNVYGGGLGQLADSGAGKEVVSATVGSTFVLVTGGTAENVFGCNNTLGGPTTTSVSVEIAGGTINNNVYGGGNLADATVNPVVTISDGTITHDVYGGGALADVDGNTTLNLTGGAVGGAYGGALGQLAAAAVGTEGQPGYVPAKEAVVAIVSGNTTVTLDGTKITETGVFGANNLNGTPQGHVLVHVKKTTPRDGQTAYDPEHPEISNSYDVPAVYGGGNLSAYVPTDVNDFAEVIIEEHDCDDKANSIAYVYGGGNAAPVPATMVSIYGAKSIYYAFAGGNGAGDGNPGADVGWLNYYSQHKKESTPYGTGKAEIHVYGGTINSVFGGSNTLGYIRGGSTASIENPTDNSCELNVDNIFAGGNEAPIDGDVEVILDCQDIREEIGVDVIYAGANKADINGNVTLTIKSGTYGKVFCGNNESGMINGSLTVNIDETGCFPVMIGELYAGGNKAPYSVYGYSEKVPRTKEQFEVLTPEEKIDAGFKDGKPYKDPTINLISFTQIGDVFGGGYGAGATIYGNTNVNVNPIKGSHAGKTITPPYILQKNADGEYVRVKNSEVQSIPDAVGIIDNIYGGGNAAAVYGNTNVNIGILSKNSHIDGLEELTEDMKEPQEIAVDIRGNVFGGGKTAVVTGNTNVTIGQR